MNGNKKACSDVGASKQAEKQGRLAGKPDVSSIDFNMTQPPAQGLISKFLPLGRENKGKNKSTGGDKIEWVHNVAIVL